MDYDDEYEDKLDRAARLVQRGYRVRLARKKMKEMVRKNYVKLYDKVTDSYFYKNKKTGAVSPEKPVFLGSDDLPDPRKLNAPFSYDPGDDGDEEGFGLLLTVNSFPAAPKLEEGYPKVPTGADHTLLEEILSHDFLCRLKPENILSFKNPSRKEFIEGLDELRMLATPKSFFTFYLCTHVVRVIGADKKNKKEDSYICFPETEWTKPKQIVDSSMSLSTLAYYLNRIPSERKTIIVNYAHREPPARSFFAPKRTLYPATDFLNRLANMCNSAVIGSCAVAASAANVFAQTPPLEFIINDYEKCKKVQITKEEKEAISRPSTPKSGRHFIDNTPRTSNNEVDGKNKSNNIHQTNERPNPNHFDGYQFPYRAYSVDRVVEDMHLMTKDMELKFRERWGTEPDKVIKLSPEPEAPHATWERSADTGYEMKVTLPTEDDYNAHNSKLRKWKCKATFRPISNYFKRKMMEWKSSSLMSPQQVGICFERGTLFCQSLMDALNGGATREDQPVQTVAEVFGFMLKRFKDYLDKAPLDPGTKKKTMQSPMLIIPSNNPSVIHNPISFSCGKPVAPERPYIVRVGVKDVTIEWYNPPFDGLPTTMYKVYMKTKSRNFMGWKEVSNPTVFTKYVVQSLPTGIGCQFSVRGYNVSGWGQYSEGSPVVIPGEETKPLTSVVRWKRIVKGGPLAVIDRMRQWPHHRFDLLNGIRLLNVFGQKQRGYPKINIAKSATLMALHCLETFTEDPEMIYLCYNLIGWCLLGQIDLGASVKGLLFTQNIQRHVEKHLVKFRIDDRVINSLSFVRWSMPNEVAQPLPMPEEVEDVNSDDDYDDEDDDEDNNPEKEEKKEEKKKPKMTAAWMSYNFKPDELKAFEE